MKAEKKSAYTFSAYVKINKKHNSRDFLMQISLIIYKEPKVSIFDQKIDHFLVNFDLLISNLKSVFKKNTPF